MLVHKIKAIIKYLENTNNKSLNMSLNNVHAEGLFSLVVSGDKPGQLIRIFIADKKIKPFDVQLHSHRYPITLTLLKGQVKQHTALEFERESNHSVFLPIYHYHSFLNGGKGLEYLRSCHFLIKDFNIPIGGSINMNHTDIHTVSCSKGSMWIVEEHEFETESSIVLGIPFTPEGLYLKPEMYQINDKSQAVLNVLRKINSSFESII